MLALDSSTAAGSAAIVCDGEVLVECEGDGRRTHGERLPGELMHVLDAARLALGDVDEFAVCVGPGSFTGLRVGIATVQGLALASGRRVAAVSAFDAIAVLERGRADLLAIWIDAHRGEVFATLLDSGGRTIEQPSSLSPAATLESWTEAIGSTAQVTFAGDGVIKHRDVIRARLGDRARVDADAPLLAGAIGRIAIEHPSRALAPHAIVPLYVRRPDAVLARERLHHRDAH